MGQERLLVGTADGFVAVIHDAETDDGSTITGSARSVPFAPAGPNSVSVVSMQPTMAAMGAGQTVDVSAVVERREVVDQTASVDLGLSSGGSTLQAQYGTAQYGTDTYADQRWITKRVNVGLKGHTFQYEVKGSSRWRLRRLAVEVKPQGMRG